jgi:folate-dependent phosphoribosylglycinamide formyltransferase PurN
MPDEFTPLRVVVLTSHSAPGLEYAIAHPHRGALFEIAAVVSSEDTFAEIDAVEAAQIRVVIRPLKRALADRGLSARNLHARADYDGETADLLLHFRADYVFLLGYNYIVTEPLLEAFPQKLIALHPGDLMLRDENGQRRYAGLRAVREAIFAGEIETRNSAYFVTREVGAGPLFLLSRPYRVAPLALDARMWGAADLSSAYADLHERWMVRAGWGEMFIRAIEFLAAGTVKVVHDLVWIDGVPGPCRMGEAPVICRELEPSIDSGIPSSCPLLRN